eukprot:11278183-Ditylum_brightwellii.AAC.1
MSYPVHAQRVRSPQLLSLSSGNSSDSSNEKRPPTGKGRGQSPSRRENSKWYHGLSQAEQVMHDTLTNQAALVAFLRNNPSTPQIRKLESHPPHLIFQ